ncbi:MAG: DegT/DnrJ/EryC1/StrS family aminotransferase [Planktothrix sp. GU0601_MAG3]|nr:MAG: DegT/DnrJ/EryC1/StrS family aminotransferase [Planktothrix sp. GU0601_MAG3]
MRETFLVFASPQIHQAEIDEVVDSLKSGWLGTGPKVKRFQEDFAAYKGVPYAAALNSCTAGLHLSCVALKLEPGDEIITTSMTFCATVNAIIHSGATPVIVDINPDTFNLDPEAIESKITPRTKAILPVHFAGRACNMEAIMDIAQRHNLAVIEDCAHAIETEYKGKKAGTFGDFGVFSFYVTKNVITGEGGMVICSDKDRIETH